MFIYTIINNNIFYLNCNLADESHIMNCNCHSSVINDKFLESIKKNEVISKANDINEDEDLLLRQLKVTKRDIIQQVGEYNVDNNIRCTHEVLLVNNIIKNFKIFDLTIPTYNSIVNSVINQSLISFRLSNYLSNNNMLITETNKWGEEHESVNPAVDYLTKVDKLIIDACEKMHKLKFGEKHVNENVNTAPKSIDDLFSTIVDVDLIEVEEE